MKTIFHVDMDAFFVSVEELFDPALKGKPVVVGGRPHERGVVSAASYEARKFGVHSAMPLRTAARLCPQAVFVDGHPTRYRDYSVRVHEVLNRYSPLVEMASIDEAYLDMTGTERLHGPPLRAAHALHETMKTETRLNCSIGISTARLVSKVASDQAKPNGVLWIVPGAEAAFLAPLEVRKIPGVGKVTEKNLHMLSIRKVGDLARLDTQFLEERFGKWGLALAGKSCGLDAGGWFDTEIGAEAGPKSISHEHTYNEDTGDLAVLESTLARLSEMVGRRLRENGLHARTLQLKLRYSDFSTITRAHSVERPTQLDTEIFDEARALFLKNWKRGARVRLLGVQASSFEETTDQLDLLDEGKHERWQQALAAADKLRDKYGDSAVSLAAAMKGTFRERTHEAMPQPKPPKPGSSGSRLSSVFVMAALCLLGTSAIHAQEAANKQIADEAGSFGPLAAWKAAIETGDKTALARLYSTDPPAVALHAKDKVTTEDEIQYWGGLKSSGLTEFHPKVLDVLSTPPRKRLLLRIEAVKDGQSLVGSMLQMWEQQPGGWRLIVTRRFDFSPSAARRLPQPAKPNPNLYPAPGEAQSDLTAALNRAAKEGKRALVVFGANWCYDCHVLDTTFHSKDFASLVDDNYVVVHINLGDEGKDNHDLADRLGVALNRGIPSLAVLNPDGTVVVAQKNGEFESTVKIGPEEVRAFLIKWKRSR